MLETSIFVILLIIQGLKTSLVAYLFKMQPTPSFNPRLANFNFYAKLVTYLETYVTLLQVTTLPKFARFVKAPYADAYWFLYSSKLTYATQRTLPLS